MPPYRIQRYGEGNANQQPEETAASLPQCPAVHVGKYQVERPEEKIQDAEEDRREYTEAQAHRFQRQK